MTHKTTVFESRVLTERYHRIDHVSGLTIYVFPKPFTTAYAVIGTRYGAADNCFRLGGESDFTTVPDGIAHFLEHKMFENEDGSDAFEQFAAYGANANAYTSSLTTAYLFSCTENFAESLGVLLHMVTHPHFTDAGVRKEQGIIAEEIRMGEDSPSRALYYGTMRAMYQVNHQRISVAGTEQSIAEITPELLYRCHRVFYNLRNMALFVCGDVTPEEVASVADACLTTAEPMEIERHEETEPDAVSAKRFYREMQVAKPLFSIGMKDTAQVDDPHARMRRQCAMDILNEILFSNASPLRASLYEDGLIGPSLSYGYGICDRYAYNMISGETTDAEEVYRRVFDYIETMSRADIPLEDFERCRRVLYANCVASYDDTSEIAHALMDTVFDEEDLFAEPEIILSLTEEDLRTVLQEVCREVSSVLAVVAPLGYRKNREEKPS